MMIPSVVILCNTLFTVMQGLYEPGSRCASLSDIRYQLGGLEATQEDCFSLSLFLCCSRHRTDRNMEYGIYGARNHMP